ncbi:hypothetical protein CCAX7_37180 [Capsulimonas corticalis]|uniref:Uncharacterized protein n=1 Tax=Capsulimonas corticalis TaxID=2219043 RepID=A0A402D184_9BACT|nr:hypothetical protein CCAX7_37180 [Capsulimonas corticalis]
MNQRRSKKIIRWLVTVTFTLVCVVNIFLTLSGRKPERVSTIVLHVVQLMLLGAVIFLWGEERAECQADFDREQGDRKN